MARKSSTGMMWQWNNYTDLIEPCDGIVGHILRLDMVNELLTDALEHGKELVSFRHGNRVYCRRWEWDRV